MYIQYGREWPPPITVARIDAGTEDLSLLSLCFSWPRHLPCLNERKLDPFRSPEFLWGVLEKKVLRLVWQALFSSLVLGLSVPMPKGGRMDGSKLVVAFLSAGDLVYLACTYVLMIYLCTYESFWWFVG